MQNHLEAILRAHREMSQAISALTTEWSANERYRNDPKRQEMTQKLVQVAGNPLYLGKCIDDIARRLNIDLP